jgi:hypothetical protein
MGSDFGAEVITPGNFGGNTSAFGSLGNVVGKVLAVSANGNAAAFSDTNHTPNQVYITNSLTAAAPVALAIPNATAAAFSPDGLKTFIIGGINSSSLYIYSPLQALQGPIALTGPANAISFSPNGAFAFIAESATATSSANITAFANCNNQQINVVNLFSNPIMMRVLPNVVLDGRDSYGFDFPFDNPPNLYPTHSGIHIFVLDSTGIDIATAEISVPLAAGSVCPQVLTFFSNDPSRPAQRIELGATINQQNGTPNFFFAPDASQVYFVNPASSSIDTYSFILGSFVGGIELTGNAVPISADISADGTSIEVVASDGLLHNVSTLTGGADLSQISFPNLPNYLNAFCSYTPSSGPCTLNFALVKP